MSNWNEKCPNDAMLLRALDGEMPPREAWRVRLHMESCAACRAQAERLRDISSLVAASRQIEAPADAAAQFTERLEAESWEPRHEAWWRWTIRARPLWRHLAWAAAVGLIVLVGSRFWARHPGRAIPRAEPVVVLSSHQPATVLPPPARRVPRKRHAVKHQRPEMPSSPTRDEIHEVATRFFALPFSDAALPLDEATMIRVDLPGSALELAGLPVAEERRNRRVRADVILGADGLARAIRFVQ